MTEAARRPSDGLDFYLFTTDVALARRAAKSAIGTAVVDWEWRGKEERQRGFDTEINSQTEKDLSLIAEVPGLACCCRINRMGPWTPNEIEVALAHGADELLLPMVEAPGEVERYLELIAGRARASVLIETLAACKNARAIARLPIHAAYVGLQDLSIERGDPHIFRSVADGTVERLREPFGDTPFGFGGLTLLSGGSPVPCRLLLAEMARLECSFSFMRRSFKRDLVPELDMTLEVERLRQEWRALCRRGRDEIDADRSQLVETIRRLPATHPTRR